MSLYTLVVQNSDKTQEKEFQLDGVEKLLCSGNVADTFNIDSDGVATVTRRIGIDPVTGEGYVLPNPITTTWGTMQIELYEGINYIKLLDDNNTVLSVTYILKNEFTDTYATRVEMSAEITATANNILLQVSQKYPEKDAIISSINLSPEEIAINSSKIALEGYTTINNGFAVDAQGNCSIANGNVKINTNGIQMASGTSIVGGNGMLTQFLFSASGRIGFLSTNQGDYKIGLYVPIYLPSNFVITDAKLYGVHTPCFFYDYTQSYARKECYARTVKLYKTSTMPAGVLDDAPMTIASGTEIYNMGSNSGKTFNSSSAENFSVTVAALKNNISVGSFQYLCFASNDTITQGSWSEANQKTGMMDINLFVSGYLQS